MGPSGKLRPVDNRIVVDFGFQGFGGGRNSASGDGYYRLGIDADRNRSLDTQRSFYRLLGDSNEDRIGDAIDDRNVALGVGTRGTNLNADLNGDDVVVEVAIEVAKRRPTVRPVHPD